MPDLSVLYVFENIYEPVAGFDGSWIVNYREYNGDWKQKSFPDRQKAYAWYNDKCKAYQTFYNVFLRETGAKPR